MTGVSQVGGMTVSAAGGREGERWREGEREKGGVREYCEIIKTKMHK